MSDKSRPRPLHVAFIHPDLGIGGAERLVVDAALGLQKAGHEISIYTSHHDPAHCFDETRDGTLRVVQYAPPFFLPRSLKGKLHIVFAHLRQLHLTWKLVKSMNQEMNSPGTAKDESSSIDIFFVDQLSTCVPILRLLTKRRIVFYCHFPDKLIASGEFVDVKGSATQGGSDNAPPESARNRKKMSLIKRIYRLPMDFLEEVTTSASDLILVNSKFTARVFDAYFSSIKLDEAGRRINPNRGYVEEKERKLGGPRVVYPGIDLSSYERSGPPQSQEEKLVYSDRPTFLSLNRFEGKKNLALAIEAFAGFLRDLHSSSNKSMRNTRLVLGGGFDPRLKDNIDTFNSLLQLISSLSLSWCMLTSASNQSKLPQIPGEIPAQSPATSAQVVLLPNFTTAQRSVLLTSPSTLALLYTPTNEHFGIVPVEAMACGLPVVACKSGGPLETVVDQDTNENESGKRKGSGEGEMEWSVVDLPSQTYSSSQPTSNQRTGWLLPPVSSEWTIVLGKLVSLSQTERKAISERAKKRARQLFSMEAMTASLEKAIEDAYEMGPVGWTEIINFEWMVKIYVVLISISILLLGGFWTVAWTGGVLVTTVIYKRVKLDSRQ